MTEADESSRLVAWSHELRTVHSRLRAALALTRRALESGGSAAPASRDLLLFCHGFCVGLTAHHKGEDRTLFPAVAAAHPELAPVLARLTQDHDVIATLLGAWESAVMARADAATLLRHLEGIEAIMESHFRYEERQLLVVLDTLALDADPADVLGPL